MEELTVLEETTIKHVEHCNTVQEGFKVVKDDEKLNEFIGKIVHVEGYPRNVIAVAFGVCYCPITESNRLVLGIDYDCPDYNVRLANEHEERTFDLFTKDFQPVEARYRLLVPKP